MAVEKENHGLYSIRSAETGVKIYGYYRFGGHHPIVSDWLKYNNIKSKP